MLDMKRKTYDTANKVSLMGTFASELEFSHEAYGECFYQAEISIPRLSERNDVIPLTVSDRLFDLGEKYHGRKVELTGQFRSYNYFDGKRTKLILSVFVDQIRFPEEFVGDNKNNNQIYLSGYLCKDPIYKKTPLGRKITDILLAVNRPCGKSDYLPCICWGRNADFASTFKTGDHVTFMGRIQSREYMKKLEDDQIETKTAYEVSVIQVLSVESKHKENGRESTSENQVKENDSGEL